MSRLAIQFDIVGGALTDCPEAWNGFLRFGEDFDLGRGDKTSRDVEADLAGDVAERFVGDVLACFQGANDGEDGFLAAIADADAFEGAIHFEVDDGGGLGGLPFGGRRGASNPHHHGGLRRK